MRRRLTRREKRSRRKKSIILSTLCLLFVMTAGYAAFQTNLNITAKGNIKEPGRVIQSWEQYSNEDFHADYYRENIVSATFLDTNQVANNATESWDVSEDGKGGVKAWVVPTTEDNTKYDLYIGANGGVIANEDSSYLFYYFTGLRNINFNDKFDTSNVVDMSYMFSVCSSLTSLDLNSFNTSKVTSMKAMFSMWNNDNTATQLTELNVSNFDTRNVTTMRDMFAECNKVTKLDVSNFNTANVTDMYHMFYGCGGLMELDVIRWNTEKVTSMAGMFWGCKNIEVLNLCSFDIVNVINMYAMFASTTNIRNIYVNEKWDITGKADTADMFANSGVSSVTTGLC